jgi:hypothetical protein
MTLACLATAHGFANAPNGLLYHLTEQSRPPDAVYLALSDVPYYLVPPVPYTIYTASFPNLGDYGYPKRRAVLPLITEDAVCFMSHDDTYSLNWLAEGEKMLEQGYDVVYSPWNEIPLCRFLPCNSTLGNFLVRTPLIQRIGIPDPYIEARARGDHSQSKATLAGLADAVMIARLNEAGARVARMDAYFNHNVPRFPAKVTVWGETRDPIETYKEIR